MRPLNEGLYWLTIALVAVVAVVAFKLLAASKVGARVPALQRVAGVI